MVLSPSFSLHRASHGGISTQSSVLHDAPPTFQSLKKISRKSCLSVCVVSAAVLWKNYSAAKQEAHAVEVVRKDGDGGGLFEGLVKLLDPNETTKSGKVLPRAYLKSAREVVKSMKDSLQQESTQESDIRRSADSAKEAIRNYLQNWRGQKAIATEDSYVALENAFRLLGQFYSKEGPRAVLPSNIKSQILEHLEQAEAALIALENAFRLLGQFYSQEGPRAVLPSNST